jgi:cobalt-zinc-cadmium efflux system outer membrane protein
MKKGKAMITILLLSLAIMAGAQEGEILTFGKYMDNVKENNIGYMAEKYSVDIADALVEASRTFADPELSVAYANNQDWSLRMGYSVDASVAYTIELGGKRRARMDAALSEREMTMALVGNYFRNLRADAAIAWFRALKEVKECEIQGASYLRMLEIAAADSIRHLAGEISETDARQSRLEAATMLNELFAAEGAKREALTELALFQGKMEIPDTISWDISYEKRDFNLGQLIETALQDRADIMAAINAGKLSEHNIRVAKASRVTDIGLSAGAGYSSRSANEIAPAPPFLGLTAGINIPLMLSNRNKGKLTAAKASHLRSQAEYEAIRAGIRTEIIEAHNLYTVACKQLEQYEGSLLDDSKAILKSKTYGWQRGEISILELLNAQRTCNDILSKYNEALYNHAAALTELGRACGIWEIIER